MKKIDKTKMKTAIKIAAKILLIIADTIGGGKKK